MGHSSCAVCRPETIAALRAAVLHSPRPGVIARGLGRSYGDTATRADGTVIDCTRLNRMLSFDPATGALACEGGVSLAEVLEVFLPRGWFLPVSPGTKFVTVGGAIANDIHGKNHHRDGTFSQHVDWIDLLLADGEIRRCSPSESPDLFWATAGGIGLTGIIVAAQFRLLPVASAFLRVDYRRTPDLDSALAAMAESDAGHRYSVCWVDCLARGRSLGRSVLMLGDHAAASDLPAARAAQPFVPPRRAKRSVPVDFPEFLLNPLSIGAFNQLFYALHPTREGCLVDYDAYFYPLDRIHQWNRLYGKRGFAQYQATFPLSEAAGLKRLLEALARSRRASFLAVLKRFGPAAPGPLSHPFEGYTLTLDLPNHNGLATFLRDLDRILLDHGARLYTAKDSTTTADAFAAMYPRAAEFRALRAAVDPGGRFASDMGRRLGLVEG
jgi:decaprenylphospho-beta-D-ribofuranose 2-oxidase